MRQSVSIAEVQRYWDARPCNVRHGTAPVGTLEWSKQVTQRKYFVEPHIPEFAQFEHWRGKRVLEVGCGIGTDTLEFLRHGAQVDAVDLSRESLSLATTRTKLHRDSLLRSGNSVNFYCANAEEWLPTGPYDLVYSFGVLHHTPRPELVMERIFDNLKLGGEFRLMLYAERSLKFWLDEQPEAQPGCPMAKTYTFNSAKSLLQDIGFDVVSIRKAHIFPWVISEYVQHRYVKRPFFKLMPRWFERFVGHHLLIVARRPIA